MIILLSVLVVSLVIGLILRSVVTSHDYVVRNPKVGVES